MDYQLRLNRQARALFNFLSMKHQNDKHIGDLNFGDFVEICEFLERFEAENADQ